MELHVVVADVAGRPFVDVAKREHGAEAHAECAEKHQCHEDRRRDTHVQP